LDDFLQRGRRAGAVTIELDGDAGFCGGSRVSIFLGSVSPIYIYCTFLLVVLSVEYV
jgi:hypothetical protein